MRFQGRGGGHLPPDGFAWPPPASTPRPVPCRPPGSGGILHRAAAMALPHHAAAYGAPPALHRPSACAFRRRSEPAAPSVAPEALKKLLAPRTALAPAAAAAAASASAPPSSAAPAGRVFSAPAPPSASRQHPVADNLHDVIGGSSKTMALQHRGAYGEPPASTPPRDPDVKLHILHLSKDGQFLSVQSKKMQKKKICTMCSVNNSSLHVYDQNMSAGAPTPSMLSRSKELAIQYPRTKTVIVETMGDDDEYYFDAANFIKGEHDDSTRENTCPPSEQGMASKVNIQFCQLKFPISPSCDTTAWDLVLSVLLKHNIRTEDFYLMLNGKPLDGNTMMKDILLFEEQTIHVCPRLRGGGVDGIDTHSSHLCRYERFDVLMDRNKGNLHRTVTIDASMRGVAEADAPFLSDISQRLLHGILAYICSDGHIGREICWEGRFTLEDILMSEDGHVRIRPTIAPVKYYPGGGAADYERLYDIVLLFVDLKNKRYPVHLKHLLFLLRNATEKLRIKPQFVMFIVNHPSLLNYAEKHKLYYLVEQLLKNLSPADEGKVSAWLQTNDSGYHIWSGYAKAAEFLRIYTFGTHGKKKKNKQSRYQAGGLLLCFQFGRNYLAHPPTDDLALAEESLSYTFHVLLTTVIECLVRKLKPQLPDANGVLIDNPSATRLTEILSNPKADPASMRCFWDEEKVLIDE